MALPNAYFASLGLPRLVAAWLNSANRPVRTRTHGGVTGKAGDSRLYVDWQTFVRTNVVFPLCFLTHGCVA